MTGRIAARVDANQPEIVQKLREIGATVTDIHGVGKGCPDILVGYQGINYLFEIKTASGRLTKDETDWHRDWGGCVVIVRSADEAIQIVRGNL